MTCFGQCQLGNLQPSCGTINCRYYLAAGQRPCFVSTRDKLDTTFQMTLRTLKLRKVCSQPRCAQLLWVQQPPRKGCSSGHVGEQSVISVEHLISRKKPLKRLQVMCAQELSIGQLVQLNRHSQSMMSTMPSRRFVCMLRFCHM